MYVQVHTMDPFLNTVVRGLASSFGFLCLFFSSFRNGVGNLTNYNDENKDIVYFNEK